MENIILMKDSTFKSGIEKIKGAWYKAGAKYSSMPTFQLKMSKNPMLRSLGSIAERYGLRIVAGTALAVIGIGGAELLMHPELAFGDEGENLSDDVQPTENVDGNEIEGIVTNVEDAKEETVTEEPKEEVVTEEPKETTHFAADPNAEKSEDFVDYSDVDYHAGKDGNPILDYHYDDNGEVVIDATPEEIAEKMQEFKDGNKEPDTEPEPTPEPEPDKPTPDKPTPDEPGKPGGPTPDEPSKPNIPVETVPQTGDDFVGKVATAAAGAVAGALTLFTVAKNKIFAPDKAASSAMRMGVVNGRPTYENINYKSIK